jgi:hypothetical protein
MLILIIVSSSILVAFIIMVDEWGLKHVRKQTFPHRDVKSN